VRVRVTIDMEVGDDPRADAITYFVHQYDVAQADETFDIPEWVEQVVLDELQFDLIDDHDMLAHWRIVGSRVEELE
jgi:hypothetical protein